MGNEIYKCYNFKNESRNFIDNVLLIVNKVYVCKMWFFLWL